MKMLTPTNSLKLHFKKDYYQDTVINPETSEVEVKPELKTMYHFSLEKDYFLDDKQEVLRQAIQDLKEELEFLEARLKQNDKALASWDNIEK